MSPGATLALGGALHARLRAHLLPGDNLEAAAILVCARTPGPRLRLLVRSAVFVPHDACVRRETSITWPGDYIEQAIDRAETEALTLIFIHSHPGGLFAFSDVDDFSDRWVIPGLFHAHGDLHGSAIMTPDGAIRARLYTPDGARRPIDLVTVSGDDLSYWWDAGARLTGPPTTPMAFTSAMAAVLGRLTAVVIGV